MANALTGINSYQNMTDFTEMSNIKSNINTSKAQSGQIRSFQTLLDEKICVNNQIDTKKLNKQESKLYNSCVDLESLLWKQVLNSMKQTVNKYKLFDGGQAEEIFTDFLYDEYSTMMSKNSNTGIATQVYKQLSGN